MPIGRGDHPKVCDVIHSQHGTNGAPHRKGLVGDLHYRGEALSRKIDQAGEQTSLSRVEVNPDRE